MLNGKQICRPAPHKVTKQQSSSADFPWYKYFIYAVRRKVALESSNLSEKEFKADF